MQFTPLRTIVLGAGPTGLATALLLAGQGHEVTVYEARDALLLDTENSYPIGVNRRGQETLRRIDPELLDRLHEHSEVVEAFHIYSGERRLARLESGTLWATTRAFLTQILAQRAQSTPGISIEFGHRLEDLDLAARTLTFTRTSGGSVTVDAADARVVAADGVHSAARHALERQVADFRPRVGDWGVRFRVAFSSPGASADGMDPAVHHIFTDTGIYTATLRDGVWCVVVTVPEDADDSARPLLATEPTEENVQALADHLDQHAPLAAPLLTREDLAGFFGRAPFGGAVVLSPRLAFDEWLVLLGDAAHSVIPSTGEGVNSGLEDAMLLAEHVGRSLATGSGTPLRDYEEARLPDLRALGTYAWTLRDNMRSTDPARTVANVVVRLAGAVTAAIPGVPSAQIESRLFGPHADREPYREAIGPWIRLRRAVVPPVRAAAAGVRGLVTRARRPGCA